jgi:hypothetical protein
VFREKTPRVTPKYSVYNSMFVKKRKKEETERERERNRERERTSVLVDEHLTSHLGPSRSSETRLRGGQPHPSNIHLGSGNQNPTPHACTISDFTTKPPSDPV